MQKFAALCAVAVYNAAALELEAEKGTLQMRIDNFEYDVIEMPQGTGQDHTLWSWDTMTDGGHDRFAYWERMVETTQKDVIGCQSDIDEFRSHFTAYDIIYEKKCELHRREEINLYYQCTQIDYNNYSLDHYGGDMRSYPRWLCEFCHCNDHLRMAEHTRVEGRWCEPSTYTPRREMCDRCGADPVPWNDNPYPEPETAEPTFSYLPNFSGYWIERQQTNDSPRTALTIAQVQGGVCVDQSPNPADWENEAILRTYPTGTAVPTEVHDLRLREGEYIEATVKEKVRGEFDTEILSYGFLPIHEQNVHKHIYDEDQVPYHPDGVFFTKIGSCDNRGAEKLWQFQLFPEVEDGITDPWVVATDDI